MLCGHPRCEDTPSFQHTFILRCAELSDPALSPGFLLRALMCFLQILESFLRGAHTPVHMHDITRGDHCSSICNCRLPALLLSAHVWSLASNDTGSTQSCIRGARGHQGALLKGLLGAELPDDVIHKTKMLKRMQVLEEKGAAFATRPLSSLPVIGEAHPMMPAPVSRGR